MCRMMAQARENLPKKPCCFGVKEKQKGLLMLHHIYMYCHISFASSKRIQCLLNNCVSPNDRYPGVDIQNFSTSWKNGLAFNALIHKHR